MTIAAAILATFTSKRPYQSSPCFSVLDEIVSGVYLCISPSGNPAMAIEIPRTDSGSISTRGFKAYGVKAADIDIDRKVRTIKALVIELCGDWDCSYFSYLCSNLIDTAKNTPSDSVQKVLWNQIIGWTHFFKERRSLSREAETGLWGELWLIDQCAVPSYAIENWHGPLKAASDFIFDTLSIEVKASISNHIHFFSINQVTPVENRFYLSLKVTESSVGVSVRDLILSILSKVANPTLLLEKVGMLGAEPDESTELARFTLTDSSRWFSGDQIPKVRQLDPGVISVRYQAALDASKAVASDQLPQQIKNLLASGS